MTDDPYKNFAERYDWMKFKNPFRDEFFRILFEKHNVRCVLDCACGTGHELILFNSFGCEVHGSDLSDSMLEQARKNLSEANLKIPLKKIDYRYLDEHYQSKFDAVVCLTSALAEPLTDTDTRKALANMRSVLRGGGILVFDQGQTDAMMKDPPKFDVILNSRDHSRLFVMDYFDNHTVVHAFDLVHTERKTDFHYNSFRICTRLKDGWQHILDQVGFKEIEYFGDWSFAPYDKKQSKRLIIVAHK